MVIRPSKLLLVVLSATVSAVSQADVTCWSYDLTVTKPPEKVNQAELEQTLKQMNATEVNLDAAVKKRQAGFTSKTKVSYWRDGDRLEGPIRSFDGTTLEILVYRFCIQNESFWKYVGLPDHMGHLEIGPKNLQRSVFSIADELLLIGDGTLASRFESLLKNPTLKGLDNPFKERVESDGEMLAFRNPGPGYMTAAFNSNTKTLTMKRYAGKGIIVETVEYREAEPEPYVPIEKLVTPKTPTTDTFDESGFPVQYEWAGARLTPSQLQAKVKDKGDRSPFPVIPVAGISVATVGAGLMLRKRKTK